MSEGMQGQFLNSQLLVQPQTRQQSVTLTPSKPPASIGKTGLVADNTPLHQVATPT